MKPSTTTPFQLWNWVWLHLSIFVAFWQFTQQMVSGKDSFIYGSFNNLCYFSQPSTTLWMLMKIDSVRSFLTASNTFAFRYGQTTLHTNFKHLTRAHHCNSMQCCRCKLLCSVLHLISFQTHESVTPISLTGLYITASPVTKTAYPPPTHQFSGWFPNSASNPNISTSKNTVNPPSK